MQPDCQATTSRRTPQQRRSRERFQRLLDAAEELLANDGYDAFTTSNVARAADIPASAVYRWFSDRDDLARALVERHNLRMTEALLAALSELDSPTLDELTAMIFDVYAAYYRANPSHVILWFDGRGGAETVREVRSYTERLSVMLRDYAVTQGLLPASTTALDVQLIAEMTDRVQEFAFRRDRTGDQKLLARGLELVQAATASLTD